MPINEADTCRAYVVPKPYNAGWEDTQISEQKNFTDGRIMLAGNRAFRRPQKRANSGLRSQESLVKALISMMEPFKEACSIPPPVRVPPKSF